VIRKVKYFCNNLFIYPNFNYRLFINLSIHRAYNHIFQQQLPPTSHEPGLHYELSEIPLLQSNKPL
jgi:hypothetical protein